MVLNLHDADLTSDSDQQLPADEWVSFPGGELEGQRPRTLCPTCRVAHRKGSADRAKTLCFACYRAELDRQKAIAAAGRIEASSDARFQVQLPFEPVNQARLDALKADRDAARQADRRTAVGPYVYRRRQAQIAARNTLRQIAAGVRTRRAAHQAALHTGSAGSAGSARSVGSADRDRAMAAMFDAMDLQLPDAWIPFVMSRSRAR